MRTGLLPLLLYALASSFAATAPASSDSGPNILFAIADDWSYGHASAYGCRWIKTPAFDRVAKNGILFTRAYTPNAKCAPSRACILTGRNPWQLKAAANHVPYFPAEFKTWPETLSENGYFVGMTQKGWAPGVATNVAGVERQMTGRPFNRRKTAPPTPSISNNDYAANFADFLSAAPTNQPWCFWYGSVEPHRAYQYGSGVAKAGKRPSDIERVPACWPDNEIVRNDLLDYALEVEYFDLHLGRMLALVEQHGQLENTLVVVTSDNGMPFPHNKGQAYHDANHLPLAVMWTKVVRQPGRVVEDYVSFIDFAPTFIELAGLRWNETGMAMTSGRSLTDILFAERSSPARVPRDHVLIGKERTDVGRPRDEGYPIRGLVQGGLLYLQNFEPLRWPSGNPETGYLDCDGSPTKTEVLKTRADPARRHYWQASFGKRPAEELYNLKRDPDCMTNLAAQAQSSEQTERLRRKLFAELKAQEDPRMFGQGDTFDRYPYANPAERGLYERFLGGESLKPGWVNESDFEPSPLD